MEIVKDEIFCLRGNFPQIYFAYFCTFLGNIKKIAIDMLIHCQTILKTLSELDFVFNKFFHHHNFYFYMEFYDVTKIKLVIANQLIIDMIFYHIFITFDLLQR